MFEYVCEKEAYIFDKYEGKVWLWCENIVIDCCWPTDVIDNDQTVNNTWKIKPRLIQHGVIIMLSK